MYDRTKPHLGPAGLSAQHRRRTPGRVALTLLLAAAFAATGVFPSIGEDRRLDRSIPSDLALGYHWSPSEQAQRKLAIEKRDADLLPVCTEDYKAWRDATGERREAERGTEPPPGGFWAAPGCKGTPDRLIVGPRGAPMADHAVTGHWWIGQYVPASENFHDRGAYAEIEIVDVGVDHSATPAASNFFAARVLAVGPYGDSLEAGWAEAAFWCDPTCDQDQHIYSQDSHSCGTNGLCIWADFDSVCDNTRNDAQVSVEAISPIYWRTSCWDGNVWNTMHNNIDLGGDDAVQLEVAGEVRRTVSGSVDLTADGVNFYNISVLGTTGRWTDWVDIGASLFDDDYPYALEHASGPREFEMKNW